MDPNFMLEYGCDLAQVIPVLHPGCHDYVKGMPKRAIAHSHLLYQLDEEVARLQ